MTRVTHALSATLTTHPRRRPLLPREARRLTAPRTQPADEHPNQTDYRNQRASNPRQRERASPRSGGTSAVHLRPPHQPERKADPSQAHDRKQTTRTPVVRCHKHADPRPLKGPGLRSYYENQRFRSATSAANASRDTISFAPSGFLESRTPMPWRNWATSTQAPPFPELRDDLRHAALLRPMVKIGRAAGRESGRLPPRAGPRLSRLAARGSMARARQARRAPPPQRGGISGTSSSASGRPPALRTHHVTLPASARPGPWSRGDRYRRSVRRLLRSYRRFRSCATTCAMRPYSDP